MKKMTRASLLMAMLTLLICDSTDKTSSVVKLEPKTKTPITKLAKHLDACIETKTKKKKRVQRRCSSMHRGSICA